MPGRVNWKLDVLEKMLEHFQSNSFKNDKSIHQVGTSNSHSNDSRYVTMLKEEAQMDLRYNITASTANWALLAGYLVVPGTFTSLQHSNKVQDALQTNKTGRAILQTIQNPPLLVIACLFFAGGTTALFCLFRSRKIRNNYPWLINKIFMLVCL